MKIFDKFLTPLDASANPQRAAEVLSLFLQKKLKKDEK